MHTYKTNIRIEEKGGDALLRGITGLSSKTNRVFEFNTVPIATRLENVKHPGVYWTVWEVREDGLYCLTFNDIAEKKHIIYYQRNGEKIGEVSLLEAMDIAKDQRHGRRMAQYRKKREQRKLKRQAVREAIKMEEHHE
jgi:hypothetical protein